MGHKLTISNVAAAISVSFVCLISLVFCLTCYQGNTKLALAQLSRARNKRRVDATRSTDPRLRTLQFQEYQENWATRAFESMRLHPATRTLPQPLALSDDDLGEASPGPRAVPRPPTPPRPSQKRLDIEKSHWYEDGHNLDENADDAATNDKTQNEAAAASSPMGPGELSEGEDPTVDDRTRKEDSSGSSQICTQEELANLTRMVFGDEDEELDESFWDDADGAPRAAITHPGSHERAGVMDQQHKEGNTGGTSEEASKLDRLFGPTPNTCLLTSSPRSHQDEDEDRNAAVVQDILEVAAGSATIDTSDSARSTENDTSPGAITSTLATSPEPSYPALNHPSPTQHSPPPESEDEAPTGNLYPRDSLEADAGIWEVLSAHNGISRTIEASTTKYRTRITSPEVQPALVAPTPGAPRPPVFASGDEATGIITPGQLALALNDRLERGDQEDVKPLLAGSGTNHAANASEQGVYDSECDGNVLHTNAVGVVGLDASRPVVEREMAGDSDEVVGLLLDAPKDWYPKDQYDQDMDAAQVDMQVDFPTPMDEGEDEDELELSHTTFDPLLTYQPHPYSHSPGIQQDDLIVEDNGAAFAADSAMEDRAAESWQTTASMRETETLLPFSWVPPSLSSALHAIFPSVPSAQTASFVNCSMPVVGPPMLPDPCAVVTMVSEGVRLQQFAPPQDIVLPFVSDSPCPSPSMQGVELLKEPASFVPKLSPTSVSTRDTTKRSSFPPLSRPMMKADPVSVSPFIWMPTQKRREEGKDLDEEVGPKPAVVTIVQPEASPLRCVYISGSMWESTDLSFSRSLNIHKSVGLDASPSQPPPANSDASLPLPCYPCAVGTMEINHFPPASASPIHPNEDGTKDEGNKVKTGDGLLYAVYALGLFFLAHLKATIAGRLVMRSVITPWLWFNPSIGYHHHPRISSQ